MKRRLGYIVWCWLLGWSIFCAVKLVLNAGTSTVAGPTILKLEDPRMDPATHWDGQLLLNGDTLDVLVIDKHPTKRTEP